MALDAWPTCDRYILMALKWMPYLDWNVRQLADRTGMEKERLREVLKGQRSNIHTDTVSLTAQAVEKALFIRGLQMGTCGYCGQRLPFPPPVKL